MAKKYTIIENPIKIRTMKEACRVDAPWNFPFDIIEEED